MIRHLLFFHILLFALAANAQQSVSISPLASFDFGSPLFINRTAGVLNPFGISSAGNSSSESYGLGIQASIPDLTGHIGLIGRLEGIYNTGSFTFTSQPYTVSGIDRKLLLEASICLDVQPFAIRAGPWISQSILRSVYENDPNGILIASGDSIASNATHVGISAGIAWQIPDFPLQPELNTHLDLTELASAGLNAWSVGVSLSYVFGTASAVPVPSTSISNVTPIRKQADTLVVPRVMFLANGSMAHGNPPLERVETHVKQYAMVDSNNAPPVVTQWVEESYHLPHLALECRFDRHDAGYLMVLKDSVRLIEKSFSVTSKLGEDTTIELDQDPAWQNVLVRLNTGEANKLVAELRTNGEQLEVARDTLILPPADSSLVSQTIVKRQERFVVSDHYWSFQGGNESLQLILGKISSLLDSNKRITIIESKNGENTIQRSDLLSQLKATLGAAWDSTGHQKSESANDTIIVEFEN